MKYTFLAIALVITVASFGQKAIHSDTLVIDTAKVHFIKIGETIAPTKPIASQGFWFPIADFKRMMLLIKQHPMNEVEGVIKDLNTFFGIQ